MRLIHTAGTDARRTKVYWNAEDREYVVKLIVWCKWLVEADYFTTCKDDAICTANVMAQDDLTV